VGVADHAGWALLVTVAADGCALDRRRVELVDADLPNMPYHHGAQGLPVAEGVALVERVRASAEGWASRGLDALAEDMSGPIRGIVLRECPPLLPTIAERVADYWSQTRADGVMYRRALARAAEARGWRVGWYVAKRALDEARAVGLVDDLDAHLASVGKRLGPPWRKEHRVAMAAAIAAHS